MVSNGAGVPRPGEPQNGLSQVLLPPSLFYPTASTPEHILPLLLGEEAISTQEGHGLKVSQLHVALPSAPTQSPALFNSAKNWLLPARRQTKTQASAAGPQDCQTLQPGRRRKEGRGGTPLSLALKDPKAPWDAGLSTGPPTGPRHTALTFPLLMTRMRSQLSTVVMRCAMTSTVQPWKASRIVCWIKVSVSMSMEAVASSIRMIW